MKSFMRWFGFHVHDWGKWTETGQISRYGADKECHTVGMSQERICETCGFKQYHKQYVV